MPTLTARRLAFVQAYVYTTKGNGAEAARLAGYTKLSPDREADRLLRNAEVSTAVAAATRERDNAIKAEGIARIENRLADLQRIRDGMAATAEARAADPGVRRTPGGEHGFVTVTYKTIPNPDPTKPPLTVQESKIDAGMITAWLATLKQAAIETGQWAADKPFVEAPTVNVTVNIAAVRLAERAYIAALRGERVVLGGAVYEGEPPLAGPGAVSPLRLPGGVPGGPQPGADRAQGASGRYEPDGGA